MEAQWDSNGILMESHWNAHYSDECLSTVGTTYQQDIGEQRRLRSIVYLDDAASALFLGAIVDAKVEAVQQLKKEIRGKLRLWLAPLQDAQVVDRLV